LEKNYERRKTRGEHFRVQKKAGRKEHHEKWLKKSKKTSYPNPSEK